VIDVALVAAGFVIRAVAGAAATDVVVSKWFLIVASFGSLFMVSGKRWVELTGEGEVAAQRAVLADYPPQFLVHLRAVSSAVTLVAYTLFAFDRAAGMDSRIPWFELSIPPFVLAVFRYGLRLEQGEGGAPEELVLADRTLQVLAVIWAVVFMIGVYAT
jgi:decaprenyl-phosphate phosphoribosyltransferase